MQELSNQHVREHGPHFAKLQEAAREVVLQLAVASNSAVSPGESSPTLPVEVLKFLILCCYNSIGQFSLNMLGTERALQLPCD